MSVPDVSGTLEQSQNIYLTARSVAGLHHDDSAQERASLDASISGTSSSLPTSHDSVQQPPTLSRLDNASEGDRALLAGKKGIMTEIRTTLKTCKLRLGELVLTKRCVPQGGEELTVVRRNIYKRKIRRSLEGLSHPQVVEGSLTLRRRSACFIGKAAC